MSNMTAETTTATTGLTDANAPISKFIPYITRGFTILVSTSKFLLSSLRPVLLLSPLPVLLYLFAPVTVFLDILATVFVRSPYRIVSYLLDALFPLYVFCGVACITGGVLGLAGRLLCRVILNAVQLRSEDQETTVAGAGEVRIKNVPEEGRKREKGKRVDRERVKFES
ncbi:unnamed protein product [Cyclocybe aegerita]|uniref:Uncharacterized protein n=1 Tax=Cyclocybe aegerita TaxID=1973307 RepID=A0A8S0WJU4_CYCAE|nr:unnamed protein product [Cyclocybe aegerita]